jgi:hypothetical protein
MQRNNKTGGAIVTRASEALIKLVRIAHMNNAVLVDNYRLGYITQDQVAFRELFKRRLNPDESKQCLDTDEAHQGIWYELGDRNECIRIRRLSASVDRLNKIPGVEIEKKDKPGSKIGAYRLKEIPILDIELTETPEMKQTRIFEGTPSKEGGRDNR